MDKEEIIETEEKIEKALKKEQEQRLSEKKKSEDFAESEAKIVLVDKAEELENKGSADKKVRFHSSRRVGLSDTRSP